MTLDDFIRKYGRETMVEIKNCSNTDELSEILSHKEEPLIAEEIKGLLSLIQTFQGTKRPLDDDTLALITGGNGK